MNLVIVESPAKSRTISAFLGKNYKVLASYGHVRDLPEDKLGVDVRSDFKPQYIVPAKSKKTIAYLKSAAKGSPKVYLATDLDREGEAISWHIAKACQIPEGKIVRIIFHEITKNAIAEALKNPRKIDINLVDAQQARRILDRLVGYKLSPLLWEKVQKGLSAGRVQSVAVRLVVEREREVRNFKPQEYWLILAHLKKGASQPFIARLCKIDGREIAKLEIKCEKEALKITQGLRGADYVVENIETVREEKYPLPPYTTSTLQQDASYRLGSSPRQTMQLAQKLYERGIITYHRTDSVNLSWLAVNVARKYIEHEFGKKYLPEKGRQFKTKTRGAQEAHEAIRPTHPDLSPQKAQLDSQKARLYELIWRRMIASQMSPALYDKTTMDIAAKNFSFRAEGLKLVFDGWKKIYQFGNNNEESTLPALKKDDVLDLIHLEKKKELTTPPPRYSEAMLIKALEEYGIGRPSTYAPTLATIFERGYVRKDAGKLVPEKLGEVVNDILVKNFPEIVDYRFTAKIEGDFDEVSCGRKKWTEVVAEFYRPFEKELKEKTKSIKKQKVEEEKTDEKCSKCGKPLQIKTSRYGKFLACTGFPDCKFTKHYIPEEKKRAEKRAERSINAGRKCPQCGAKLIMRRGRYGAFIGCTKYPKCKYLENINPKS